MGFLPPRDIATHGGSMDTAVVIPTYERPTRLVQTVKTVCAQTTRVDDVILVDDGSPSVAQERALDRCERTHARVRVIRQDHAGPAAARNRGWRASDAEYVLFTDDDCLVPPEWVERLSDGFVDQKVGAVGGPLSPPAAKLETSVFARVHRYRNDIIYEVPTTPTVGSDLPMGGTANVCYRRDALAEVGGFDESFPIAAGEDADLQARVEAAGYRVAFVPAVVVHNDDYNWREFYSRAIRHGAGTYHYHRRRGGARPLWRVLIGVGGAPRAFVRAMRHSHDPALATTVGVEHVLSRMGEAAARG